MRADSDTPPDDTSGADASRPTDSRWPAPTRAEMLGRRAHQRPTTAVEDRTVTTTAGAVQVPELPDLEHDCYCLDPATGGGRARRRTVREHLHALALDTALGAGGDVVWVDAQGHATTHTLARVAPSERALERVHVARAFTTHQHRTLVEQVGQWLDSAPDGPFGSPETDRPAVVVCPAVDALYRAGECRESAATDHLARVLAVLQRVAREHDLPVLVTRTARDAFAAPVDRATTTIEVEQTRAGPRFACEALAFETLVYPVGNGLVQTTLAFWRDVLAARHPEATAGAPATPRASGGPAGGS